MCEKCEFPGPPWKGKLSKKELRRLCESPRLKIKDPVRIRRGGTPEDSIGTYDGGHYMETGEHLVSISPRLSKVAANKCIVHELTHAAQKERDGAVVATLMYSLAENLYGYRDNPFEVEARENAEALHEQFQVVVA